MTTKIDGTNGITYPDNSVRGSGSLVAGVFKKLAASATGLSALIAITADAVVLENSSNLSPVIARSVNISLDTSTVGLNGLDTGTLAASTWYYNWIISDGINVRAVASLSATAPNVSAFPTYVYAARVGAFRTDGTANKYPLSYQQYGRRVQYKVAAGSNVAALPIMATGSAGNTATPTWAAVAIANYVPPTASEILINLAIGTANAAMAAPNNAYGALSSASNPPPLAASNVASQLINLSGNFEIESSNIYWASANASNNELIAAGWVDNI